MVIYTTPSQATDPAKQSASDIFVQFARVVSPDHALL